jgi:hypothetical protein
VGGGQGSEGEGDRVGGGQGSEGGGAGGRNDPNSVCTCE